MFLIYNLLTIFDLTFPVLGRMSNSKDDSLYWCSKYHFEEKVLEKLIRLEHKMEIFTDKMKQWESEINFKSELLSESKSKVNEFLHSISE